jgi:hypothetical protein
MNFEAGTTGEVEFVCRYFRFESVGGAEISAPFSQIEPIVSDAVVVSLPSGVDPDVVPFGWSYLVKIRVTGQNEYVAFLTMPMTDVNAVEVIVLEEPAVPDLYVLKSDFLDHLDAIGDPVSHAYVDTGDATLQAAIDAETARAEAAEAAAATDADIDAAVLVETNRAEAAEAAVAGDLATEVTNRIADVDAEETRATGAEGTLTTNLAAEVTRATTAEGTLTTNLASEVTNRTADVDAEETARIAADSAEVTARNAAIATETTNRIADVDAEETRALAAEALKAPLASPALTGNPTVPNQTAGDNDTSAANTAFVTGAVASEATARTTAIGVETTNRIADVDAEESRALAAEALLAPLASPALTGNPTVPTQTAGNSSTRAASTAFVGTAVGAETTARIADVDAEETRALAAEALLAPKASPTLTGTVTIPTVAGTADSSTKAASTAFVQAVSGLYVPLTVADAKGDIIAAPVGADGKRIVSDSSQTFGMRWVGFVGATISEGAQNAASGTTINPGGTGATESKDTDGFHSDVTNPQRFTIPTGLGGTYFIFVRVLWSAPAAATGTRRLGYNINGSGNTLLGILPGSTVQFQQQASAFIQLAAGDFIDLTWLQNSGSTITATLTEFSVEFRGA